VDATRRVRELCPCGCGRTLPPHPGSGRSVYFSHECFENDRWLKNKEYFRKYLGRHTDGERLADQNARKFDQTHGLTRSRSFLLLGVPQVFMPTTTTAKREDILAKLERLRAAVVSGDRHFASIGAEALLREMAGDKTLFRLRVTAHCEEFLRDVGILGDSLGTFQTLDRLARRIEARYKLLRDPLNLSVALIVHANLFRTFKYYPQAEMYLKGAIYKLEGQCKGVPDQDAVKIARHQALLWLVRVIAIHDWGGQSLDRAEPIWNKLERITAEDLGESAEMQTMREGIGYFYKWRTYDRAQQCLERAKILLEKVVPYSSVTDLTILRPEIELSLGQKNGRATDDDRDNVSEYAALLNQNPNSYQLRVLHELENKCHMPLSSNAFDIAVMRSTPILTPLYLEQKLTKL
jgi:tetratricopeptide (TPR) repeat protein